jgi:uncharacterized protein (DUF2249 family)
MAYVLLHVHRRSKTVISEHLPEAHPVAVQLGARLTRSAHYAWRNLCRANTVWRVNM